MKLLGLLLLGTVISPGAPAPGPTQAQVDNWTRTWQTRLDLVEWHITASIVRLTDLKPDTVGNIKWESIHKTAVIKVLDPLDYNLPPEEIASDIEYTILHELTHLELSVLPRNNGTKMTEETVVNRLSEALFRLEKGRDYKPRNTLAKDFVKPLPPAGANRAKR